MYRNTALDEGVRVLEQHGLGGLAEALGFWDRILNTGISDTDADGVITGV